MFEPIPIRRIWMTNQQGHRYALVVLKARKCHIELDGHVGEYLFAHTNDCSDVARFKGYLRAQGVEV